MKTILILGSSGLVGKNLLIAALKNSDYSQVIVLNRRPSHIEHPKLTEIITDFSTPPNLDNFLTIDSLFSCLGTTKKKTPRKEDYRRLEVTIPTMISKSLIPKGISQVHYISSIGSKPHSSNFYLRVKGEAEIALTELELPHLHIYRPSLLIGERNETRLAEDIWSAIFSQMDLFFSGKATKYKRMKAVDLAESMIEHDLDPQLDAVSIYHYDEIMESI